ncbi:TonB-dependent receptor [Pedobacter sp. P351]|uniref:TonB-dependent receptor n=1 Tax=Pedobacter superstes TaxID=3133441 RepID=UPI00309667B4
MYRIISTFILWIAFNMSYAQTTGIYGGITGRVTTSDGQPAADVAIGLLGSTMTTMSNEDGIYTINRVRYGSYTIQLSGIGLKTQSRSIDLSTKKIVVDFTIEENAAQLKEVTITSSANKYKVDKVSSSLRLQTDLLEVPQNIKVVTRELIGEQLVFDMVDGVTRNVSGATRTGHWDAQYANIQMRGSTIPAFRNGINMKMPWGPMSDDMSIVERIEFVKGPAGFMMAHGEPGGFYNIVTKKPTGTGQGSASISAGSYNTTRAALDLDGKLSSDKKLLYRLNLMGQTKDMYNKYNFADKYLIAPVLSYRVDSNTTVTAEYTHQHVEAQALGTYSFSRNALGDVPRSFFYGDPSTPTYKINDHNIFLYLNHRLNNNWSLDGKVAYVNYSLQGGGIWPGSVEANGNMTRAMNMSEELAINMIGQISLKGEFNTGSLVHRLLAGVDKGHLKTWGDFSSPAGGNQLNLYQYIGGVKTLIPFNVYNPQYGILLEDIPVLNRSRSLRERSGSNTYATDLSYTGLYLQDELRFLDERLRLTLAGRFTNSVSLGKTNAADIKDNVITPRIGLSFSVDKQTSVYGLYDQTYLPTAGADYFGNAFEPVRGSNLEFGIKKEWFNGKLISGLSAYTITKENVLTADIDPEHQPGNWQVQVGEVRTRGIEFDITGEILPGLNATLNYAFTEPKVTKDQVKPGTTAVNKTGTYLSGTVKNVANGWLSYRLRRQGSAFKGLGISGGAQYQTGRFAGANYTEPNFTDYLRFDAGLSYQKGKMTFSGLVNNVFDKTLYTQGNIPQNPSNTSFYYWIYELPRNYRFSVAYKF